MLVRGAEPMEKRQRRGLLPVPGLLLTCLFPVLSPDSVDNSISFLSE